MKLGEILIKQGLITQAHLQVALAGQEIHHERLGTFLIETGVLTTDQVALALAEQFDVAPALEADFVRVDPGWRHRLSAQKAIEFQAIPLFSTGPRRAAVAMVNPTNTRILDELAFAIGATVEPMVASEVAITRQLEHLYMVPRPYTTGSSMSIDHPGFHPPKPTHHTEPKDAGLHLPPLLPGTPVEPGSGTPIASMEDALCFTPTPLTLLVSPAHRTAPAPTRTASHHPLTPISVPITSDGIDLAVEQIRFATDPQIASDYLFCFLRSCFGVGAMFAVSGVLAQGRFGFSAGLVRPAVESITFSLSLPSCFRIARSRRTLWRGAPPPDGQAVHRTLWMALRCAPPSEVLVCPVIVDSQVTLLVYAQGNQGESLDSQSANRMEQVCSALGDSLLRLAV